MSHSVCSRVTRRRRPDAARPTRHATFGGCGWAVRPRARARARAGDPMVRGLVPDGRQAGGDGDDEGVPRRRARVDRGRRRRRRAAADRLYRPAGASRATLFASVLSFTSRATLFASVISFTFARPPVEAAPSFHRPAALKPCVLLAPSGARSPTRSPTSTVRLRPRKRGSSWRARRTRAAGWRAALAPLERARIEPRAVTSS